MTEETLYLTRSGVYAACPSLFITQRMPFDDKQRIFVYPENLEVLTDKGFKMVTKTQYSCPANISLWDIQEFMNSLPNFYQRKLA